MGFTKQTLKLDPNDKGGNQTLLLRPGDLSSGGTKQLLSGGIIRNNGLTPNGGTTTSGSGGTTTPENSNNNTPTPENPSNDTPTSGSGSNGTTSPTFGTYTYSPMRITNATATAKANQSKANNAYNDWLTEGYKPSQGVTNAGNNKYNAEYAVKNYGDFSFSQSDAFKTVMDQILNREKFSYDMNSDALYQQYKDKYIQQGKMAMADTMGQAAAMTGGYGNSYAAAVGNQAYQSSLQQLNDVIPELYQMAYDRYNQEGQDLYNQYGMLSNERTTEYGMWNDGYNKLVDDRNYYGNDYYNISNQDYGRWMDEGNILDNNRNYWSGEYDSSYNRDWNEHTTSEGYKYQSIADANARAMWQAEYDEDVRQFDETMDFNETQANKPSSSNTTTTPSLSPSEFNDVMNNAGTYAEQGQGVLENYLRGMMSRGYLSPEEANNIRQHYFPTKTPNKGGTGAGGGSNTVQVIN